MTMEERLKDALQTPVVVIEQAVTDSTNTDCKRYFAENGTMGAPLLITAETQTAGRGRQGKQFSSPPGGLYMSIAADPETAISQAVRVTAAASVAVCRALEAVCGLSCRIKWVNDIMCHGKKLCGILTEAVNDYTDGTTRLLVIGVGVNLTSFPEGLSATSVLAETGRMTDKDALCAEITVGLLSILGDIRRGDFSYMEEYRRRSCVIGREVLCIRNGVGVPAHAAEIDDDGGLVVSYPSGERETLTSGEVTLRIAD